MTRLVTVVGAGAVGARITRRLIAAAADVEIAVRDTQPAVATTLVNHLGGRARAVDDIPVDSAVIVLAHPRPHAALVERLVAAGTPVVSVSDDLDDIRRLLALDSVARANHVPLVVGAAMSPGLSGLLARHLTSQFDAIDEIHVAVHGTGGPACARQHHRALAGTSLNWHDRSWVERPAGSGRELCWFPDPLGAWDCYRADIPDPVLLVEAFPTVERVSARLSANRRDRFTSRLPMLRPPHQEGGLGGLRVEVRGARAGERLTLVAGVSERVAVVTAAVAGVMALAALGGGLPSGVIVPGQVGLDTRSLLIQIADAGLSLREFVGTEERTGW